MISNLQKLAENDAVLFTCTFVWASVKIRWWVGVLTPQPIPSAFTKQAPLKCKDFLFDQKLSTAGCPLKWQSSDEVAKNKTVYVSADPSH